MTKNRFKSALTGHGGAFDLPSIVTAVVVVLILTAGVLTSVFGIIPFAQDNGAKQDAAAIRTAEAVAMAKDGRYMNSADLITAGYLPSTTFSAAAGPSGGSFERAASVTSRTVEVNSTGTCYVAVVHSGTGTLFHITNKVQVPTELTPTITQDCLDSSTLQTLATGAGGYPAKYIAAAPSSITATVSGPTTASFSWNPVPTATGYLVETQINGGTWTVLNGNQTGTTATVTGAQGATINVRVSTLNVAGTSAPAAPVGILLPVPSVTWTSQSTLGTATNWAATNISADGTKIAISKTGTIYTSANSGATWTTHTGTDTPVIVSTDGSKAMTVRSDHYAYDTYNYGASWTQQSWPGTGSWRITGSADGNTRLMTCGNDTILLNGTSEDSAMVDGYVGALCANGLTMAPNGGLYGEVSGGNLYYIFGNPLGTMSTGWSHKPVIGASTLSSLAFSSTMKYIITADSSGYVFQSSDQGATWQRIDALGKSAWSKVAISDDGTKRMAAAANGYLYSSINSGATWTQETGLGTGTWTSVRIAGNGSYAIATKAAGQAFVGKIG